MEKILKPCPFCSGEVSLKICGEHDYHWYLISRANRSKCVCRVFMGSEKFDEFTTDEKKEQIRNDLVETWNRRTLDER
jgi:hypothetical protein